MIVNIIEMKKSRIKKWICINFDIDPKENFNEIETIQHYKNDLNIREDTVIIIDNDLHFDHLD